MQFGLFALVLGFLQCVTAQYPPSIRYSTLIQSPLNPDITIAYKSPPPGTCTTIFESQKQFTGYISLPPFTLAPIQQNYSINTFFWFIEARKNPETAPLTIWLNGGPGSSSMVGLFQEVGPCEVVQMADGTFGTRPRLWGWDRSSNVLFIDQPAQVGFSYDTPTNFSYDFLRDEYSEPGSTRSSQPGYTFLNGTFSSRDEDATANTTLIAAHALWHFLQGFLATFPEYNPGVRPNNETVMPTGVNLFVESYGGIYGPTYAALFEDKNNARNNGTISADKSLEIRLTSLGIVNGMIDRLIQTPFYPTFAFNNTYDVEAITRTDMLNGLSEFRSPGGCRETLIQCRIGMRGLDPAGEGDVALLNTLCRDAEVKCLEISNIISSSGKNIYDIRQDDPSPFPSPAYLEYLNSESLQAAIGARVNFTESNSAVYKAFFETGDILRGTQISSLAGLLSQNIRVALIYGDADYVCNWLGGEAVSFEIASQVPSYSQFDAAGYADIIINDTYVGGIVRQFGNLSFSRIYDAGHLVPAYQPETAFTVFTRIIQGTDIATGESIDLSEFGTTGPSNATYMNESPPSAEPTCWVRAVSRTCTDQQIAMMLAGKGVVINGVLYENEDDYDPPHTSIVAGVPGSLPSSSFSSSGEEGASTTIPVTGVYVATASPTRRNAGARPGLCFALWTATVGLMVMLSIA